MKKEQLEKLLEGKTPTEVAKLGSIAQDPILQVSTGLDFTNVHVQSIGGAVRFCGFESYEDSINPQKFMAWSVCYVNGPMSNLYRFTDSELARIERDRGPQAVVGLRNSSLFCRGVRQNISPSAQ